MTPFEQVQVVLHECMIQFIEANGAENPPHHIVVSRSAWDIFIERVRAAGKLNSMDASNDPSKNHYSLGGIPVQINESIPGIHAAAVA